MKVLLWFFGIAQQCATERTANVAERLIEAYRLNRQPELADEMQRVLDSLRERNLLAQLNSKEE